VIASQLGAVWVDVVFHTVSCPFDATQSSECPLVLRIVAILTEIKPIVARPATARLSFDPNKLINVDHLWMRII
jgi:hypothetical protein